MKKISGFKNKIFNINDKSFDEFAIELFHFQAENNLIYRKYLQFLDLNHQEIKTVSDIPFLPISFFKTQRVLTGTDIYEKVFESSGTTGMHSSKHYVHDTDIYLKSLTRGFKMFYGDPGKYTFFYLLPGYLERQNSSLVFMANHLIKLSDNPNNDFYLNNFEELHIRMRSSMARGEKIFMLGVSFALLELAEQFPMKMREAIIMETGGMKGRRKEMPREELHQALMQAFEVKCIHSEYGMTELLSQAYADKNGLFKFPPWARVMVRDIYDPFKNHYEGSGQLKIIDLANIYSVSFIETEDLGKVYDDGHFEILGRLDHSDLRGCNLLYG